MNKSSRIYIAGHQCLVGSAILNTLLNRDYKNLITRTHLQLDLTNTVAVEKFFEEENPEYVFLSAAKEANNTYRADCMYQNLMIQTNVIQQSFLHGVTKLLFIGSTCIYPKNSPQPIREDYLLTNTLEYAKEPYAIAKIAGIKMCESYNIQYGTNFISVMPTNLYGPNDDFDLKTSHVLPALIRKIHLGKALEDNNWDVIADDLNRRPLEGIDGSQGKKKMQEILGKYGVCITPSNWCGALEAETNKVSVEIWGSGRQIREFLWSEDLAEACLLLMEHVNFLDLVPVSLNEDLFNLEVRNSQLNIGTGREISIAHLAEIVKIIIKFRGQLHFNNTRPEGAARKLSDVAKIKSLGWKYSVELDEGIYRLYCWYKSSIYHPVKVG